jgi:NTP pyrophosphatase (non-canonical NTP hydrolase)
MDFNDYQEKSRETAIYPNLGNNIAYPTLGLCGESGEVAEVVKKIYRDDGGEISDEKREKVKKELGDVLWYVSNVAWEFGLRLDEIAEENINKLNKRMAEGKLHGSGSER